MSSGQKISVASVITIDDEEKALEIANDTDYGLAAGVWTIENQKKRMTDCLRASIIWVNVCRVVALKS